MKISYKFKLTKAALVFICGLISVLLKLIAHPLSEIFPISFHQLLSISSLSEMEPIKYVVCPNGSCNQLYKATDAQYFMHCNNVILEKAVDVN